MGLLAYRRLIPNKRHCTNWYLKRNTYKSYNVCRFQCVLLVLWTLETMEVEMAMEMAIVVVGGNADGDYKGMTWLMSDSSCRRVFSPLYIIGRRNRVSGRLSCELTLGAFMEDVRGDVTEGTTRGTSSHGNTSPRLHLWTQLCASN